uniref:C2H2-type domain-containing protein n=1 Tax=Eptatretus burgeri TaxID=7764 RepID=A0A8C4QIV5_EPTBU
MDSRRDRGGVGLVPAWLEIQGLSEESLRAAVTGLGIEILGALCARAEPPTVRVRLCCLAARKFTYTMYVELCRYMESCRAGRGSELTVVAGRGKPVEEPTGLPVEEPTGLPVEEPTGLPVEEPTGLPVEEPTGLPVEEPTGLPVEEPTGLPVEEPTGLPVEEPTGLPVEVLRIKVEAEESVSSEEERRNPENGVRRKLSKNFTCILCSRRLTTKANLINHMNRHQLVSGTNESASPLPPPLPPPQKKMKFHADYDSHRYIKAEWFVMFKWLNFNQQANVFTCKNCIWANKINIFSKGKLALKPKKDDFIKHEKLPDHQDAVKAESRPKEMKVATTTRTFFKESKDTMIAAFRTVLCVAQEDVAANKVDAIVKLQLDNVNAPTEMNWNWGASVLRTSEGEPHKGDHYTDHDRVVDIQQCLKRVVDKKLQSDVIKAGYYSIEADEVTDTSNKSIIIVYVRYLSPNSGKPESHFLGVRELYMPSVDGIFHVIKKLLNEKGLDISKMVGMVTDGASVTCDSRTAVVTNFKMIAPFLIGNHCMAHRLQLAAKKAANEILEIQKYIGSLGTFAWAIRNSPKVILTLEASKELHPEKVTQIKQVFSTRWLSFCDSTQAVAGCIPSIIIALHAATEDHSDAIRKTLLIGLTKDIATYKFAMLTHFLADAICFLGILRKSMLMENPTFQQLKKRIDTCVTALQSLRHMDGPYMKQLKGVFPALPPDSGLTEWGTHSIKDTVKERAKFQTARDLFLGEILTRLETTFPDKDIMSAFDVFSPMAVAGEEANGKFDRLVELYGKGKFLNWKNHDRLIDPEATRLEWTSLQGDVSKFGSTQEFYLRFLKTNANDYPNVTRLVAVGLTVPITSVNCERGILKYNAIKTDDMNSLRVENVDRLLTLNSETSRFQDFDYETAFIEWCSMKDRRAFDFTMRKYETPAAHSVAAQDFEDPEVDAIDENPVLDLNKNSE